MGRRWSPRVAPPPTQVRKDLVNDRVLSNEGEYPHRAAAGRTREWVHFIEALQQLRPAPARLARWASLPCCERDLSNASSRGRLTVLAADERAVEARRARDDVTARSRSWR